LNEICEVGLRLEAAEILRFYPTFGLEIFFSWLVYYIEPKASYLIYQLYLSKASESGRKYL